MAALATWDYVIIVAMLITSAVIGVVFAVRSRRNQTSSNYFLGDRQIAVLPAAISVAATFISTVIFLGTPAEVYIHGPKYGLMVIVRFTVVPIVIAHCFIPVFYRLGITTVYEYLEMRFNNTVRFLVIAAELIGGVAYMGIIVYAPALALSTVTGLNLNFSILAIGVICTFYTSIGGIKAVIWTDVFQTAIMILGSAIMIIAGTVSFGGPSEGWRRAAEGERTHLVDFNIDPTVRLTFWTIMIGGSSFQIMIGGTKQSYIQRYLSCKSVSDSQKAAWLGLVGTGLLELLAVVTGMTIFAYYYRCHPLTSGTITRPDQIVPYYMVDFFQSAPGVPGFLISGAFCASLSSLSSVLNALASIAGQDIVKTIWPNITDTTYSMVIKLISAVFGVIGISLAFLASVLGDVLQTTFSISGLIGGPIFGIFLLALFVPRGNSVGAITGMIAGTLVGLFLYVGSRSYPPVGQRRPPLSVGDCDGMANETSSNILLELFTIGDNDHTTNIESVMPTKPSGSSIFGISYLYLTTISALVSFVLGVVISYLTSFKNPQTAKADLLAPVMVSLSRPKNDKRDMESAAGQNESVELQKL